MNAIDPGGDQPAPARQALDLPDLCRAFRCGGIQQALSQQPRQGADRPVRRLRSADADRLRPRPCAGARRGRQGRRADQPSRRHAGAVRPDPARADEHLDDDQRDGGLAALALHRGGRRAGSPTASALQGTTQNDLVKEYLSRGTYVFPPRPSHGSSPPTSSCSRPANCRNGTRRMSAPTICRRPAPRRCRSFPSRSQPRSPLLDSIRARPEVTAEEFPEVVGRISFFVNAGMRFVTELCKMRAFVELWDEITLGRYGVADEPMRRFRYGVQVNSLGLTEPQPENNVYRILIEMLAVTLSKKARARAVQLPAWNEALGLPRPFDQQWSLRMQQVLAYETDLLEFGDIFDGSTVIDAKVADLKAAALEELARIDDMGGALAADRDRLHEAGAGRERRPPDRGDRARRADRHRRQQIHQQRALAALGRRRQCRHRAGLRRAGGDRPAQGLALGPRRQGRRSGARGAGLAPRRKRATSCRPRSPAPRPASPPANGRRRCARSSANTARRPASIRRSSATMPASPRSKAAVASAHREARPPRRASSSASPGSTAIPTAPSRSRCAPAMPAWR